jgi:membrane protease YdiL (CAAX protease family)
LVAQRSENTPWTLQQTWLGVILTLVPWIALAVALTSLNGSVPTNRPVSSQVDLASAITVFIFGVLIEATFLIAPFTFALRALRDTPARLRSALQALGFRGFATGNALLWIALFFVAILFINRGYQILADYLVTTFHLPPIQTNDQVILSQAKYKPLTVYAQLLIGVLVAPICEEVFFRGFVLMGLLRALPVWLAIGLSALIFAVAHADPSSFPVLLCIGLALAFLRWQTRSLWPGIALHLINNGLGALLIVLAMHGILLPF